MPKKSPFDAVEAALKEYALRFPGAVEEHPWDHIAIKVKKKMFFIIGGTDERKSITVKLPSSGRMALLASQIRQKASGSPKYCAVTLSSRSACVTVCSCSNAKRSADGTKRRFR